MNQLNSIILEGNLVRDCSVSETCTGVLVAKFSIGVNRTFNNRENQKVEEVSYFDIECYGNMAKYAKSKAVKGCGVRVVGRLKQNTWKNNEGKSCSRVYIVAEHIEYKPIRKQESQSQSVEESSAQVCF